MRRIDKYSLEELKDKYKKSTRTHFNEFAAEYPIDDFVNYCNEKLPTVQRIATINTVEVYIETFKKWAESNTGVGWETYLGEEFEVEE